ncbi:MAG: Gfo/Idh/MocA family oxidoreductase [Planctomycetota bacterium]
MAHAASAVEEDRERVRVGVAGLTHTHVHWILGRPDRGDIQLVGIAEPNRDLAERYCEQHGLPTQLIYPTLEAMLDEAEPEAVTAFGTIREHLQVVEACAPRGVHVMVEKPLAVSGEHARLMALLAREHGVHLLTNYETSWYPSLHELKRRVDAGEIGDLRKVVAHAGHPGPIEIGCNPEFTDWLCDPVENGGGALTDFGCYGVNLMTWLCGGERPRSVTAVTQQIKPEMYPLVEDEATIVLTYPGCQAIVQASWNWPIHRKDLAAYGTKGLLDARDSATLLSGSDSLELRPLNTPELQPSRDDPFAMLAAVVRGRVDPAGSLSSLENNLIVVEVLDAAKRSAETGQRTELSR